MSCIPSLSSKVLLALTLPAPNLPSSRGILSRELSSAPQLLLAAQDAVKKIGQGTFQNLICNNTMTKHLVLANEFTLQHNNKMCILLHFCHLSRKQPHLVCQSTTPHLSWTQGVAGELHSGLMGGRKGSGEVSRRETQEKSRGKVARSPLLWSALSWSGTHVLLTCQPLGPWGLAAIASTCASGRQGTVRG